MLPIPDAWMALASSAPSALLAEGGPDLGKAFGRLHPLVVHFPIALALVAVGFEWWRGLSRRPGMSPLTVPLLWIGAISALASTATGWVVASERSSSTDTLELHRWIGTATSASLVVLAWWAQALSRNLANDAGTMAARAQLSAFRWNALVAGVAMSVTGHLGGNLVHGEGYLTDHLWPAQAAPAEAPKDASAAQTISISPEEQFFLDKVRPIMEAHCFECHGARKQKGGLRMDSKAWLFNGEPDGWTVQPGKAEMSLLVARVKLPRTDPDAMPPEGDGLTADEIAALEKWINDGAAYPVEPAGIAPVSAVPSGASSAVATAANTLALAGPAAATFDATTRARAEQASKSLAARGVLVQPLALDSALLDVSAARAEPALGDADAELLAAIGPVVANLNLAGTQLTDAGFAKIGGMPNLERLRLDGTAVGDAGLSALGTLPKLESINLVGTKVTAASAAWLKEQPALRRIYVWKTGLDAPEVLKDLSAGGRVQVVGADLPLAQPTTPPMPEDPKPEPAAPADAPKPQ